MEDNDKIRVNIDFLDINVKVFIINNKSELHWNFVIHSLKISKGDFLKMFFKNSRIDTRAVNNACWVTFTFWFVVLFINSIFELILNKYLISSSFVILVSGLVIFFFSNYIFVLRYKKL